MVTPICSAPKLFLRFFKNMFRDFITHNYVVPWQDSQFKESLRSLGKDVILSIIDFVENYTFVKQNEVQEAHWHSLSITILVHIMYKLNPDENPNVTKIWLLKEIHFYILRMVNMTHFLCNIDCSYIGSIWQMMVLHQHNIKFSLMDVRGNLSLLDLFILSFDTLRLLGVVGCCGPSLGQVMGRENMMGQVQWWSALLVKQLNAHGHLMQNVKDVVHFLQTTKTNHDISSYATISSCPLKQVFWHIKESDVDYENS